MDEGDGPGSEGNTSSVVTKKFTCHVQTTVSIRPTSLFLFNSTADLMDEYPSVPTSIAERYKVGRTLGDGNFAVVRECVERSTGREYALKIISKDKCRGKVSRPVQLLTVIIRPPCLVSFSAKVLFYIYHWQSPFGFPTQFVCFLHQSTDGAIRLNSRVLNWLYATV